MSKMQPFEQLEHDWAVYNDLDPAGMVACSSGTAALHIALEAMRLSQGSEVIVPDLTMIAVPRAVTLAGLTPVFVDCDDTLNMDTKLRMQCGIIQLPKVNCMIIVHTYGRRVDVETWAQSPISAKIVEDLAEAHGVKPSRYTDAACWSFYKNKIVAGEEGGAVWFRNNDHAALARQLRSLGFTDAHDYNHVPRGHNYRLSNIHASLILDSLRRYEDNVKGRREQERLLDASCPDEWRMPGRDAPWVYDIRVKGMTGTQQDAVVKHLNDIGIAARHAFKPMHMQEEYQGYRLVPPDLGCYIKSWVAAQEVIYLPLTPNRPRIDKVVFEEIKRILDKTV